MAGLLDDHGSGYHPVVATGGGEDGHQGWWSGMWIFAIVIIFFALILIWRRDGDGKNENKWGDGLLPAMAMGMASRQRPDEGYGAGRHEIWDVERDQMREFCNIRQEIKDTAFAQQRENDKYFYENRAATDRGFYETRAATDQNRYDTLLGFKNTEILGLQNKGEIVGRIDGLEKRMDQDIIRKQGEELNYLKTVMALAPKPPMPAYFPNYGVPVQNVYACEPGCYPAHS